MIIQMMKNRLEGQRELFNKDLQQLVEFPNIRLKPFRGKFSNKQIQRTIESSSFDVTRCYMKWTETEDNSLIKLFKSKSSEESLAKKHKRTVGAIHCRLIRLGLIPKD